MDITGKIIAVLEVRRGVSARSGAEWAVGSFVLETQEQYPKKVCFEVFGTDRLAQFNIQMGELLTISVDIDAHEYNGRWFNQIRAFRVQRGAVGAPVDNLPPVGGMQTPMGAAQAPFGQQPAYSQQPPVDLSPISPAGEDDGSQLPF